MKKTVSILIVLTLVLAMLAGCGSSDAPASTELGQSENVVILVLDALSSQYLSQMGNRSNLAKIARAGAANLNARCVYPSHTLTNHATPIISRYDESTIPSLGPSPQREWSYSPHSSTCSASGINPCTCLRHWPPWSKRCVNGKS